MIFIFCLQRVRSVSAGLLLIAHVSSFLLSLAWLQANGMTAARDILTSAEVARIPRDGSRYFRNERYTNGNGKGPNTATDPKEMGHSSTADGSAGAAAAAGTGGAAAGDVNAERCPRCEPDPGQYSSAKSPSRPHYDDRRNDRDRYLTADYDDYNRRPYKYDQRDNKRYYGWDDEMDDRDRYSRYSQYRRPADAYDRYDQNNNNRPSQSHYYDDQYDRDMYQYTNNRNSRYPDRYYDRDDYYSDGDRYSSSYDTNRGNGFDNLGNGYYGSRPSSAVTTATNNRDRYGHKKVSGWSDRTSDIYSHSNRYEYSDKYNPYPNRYDDYRGSSGGGGGGGGSGGGTSNGYVNEWKYGSSSHSNDNKRYGGRADRDPTTNTQHHTSYLHERPSTTTITSQENDVTESVMQETKKPSQDLNMAS